MDNRQIAELISERIGPRPVPFEAVRTLALEIYHDLGGREDDENFADIFEILLSILPLTNLIDDTSIYLDKTWSSYKIDASLNQVISTLDGKQDVLTAGQNIDITDNAIKAVGYRYDTTNGAFAEGDRNIVEAGITYHKSTATGIMSHAEGDTTVASGVGSHAEGFNNTASGKHSHTEGSKTEASGDGSHAEGWNTHAKASQSHAEGSATQATGQHSHAEGYNSFAYGRDSHAEGNNTKAGVDWNQDLSWAAHAEGMYSQATGYVSHSEGQNTIASGTASHAEGIETEAYNIGEHASGMFNKSNNKDANAQTIFSIGIGTSDTDRKNAIEILRNGQVLIKGIGGYDGTNPFDCNFGGIVCLTLGKSMETTQAEKIITVLQDILTNKKHYILTIYDTVEDKFFGDCEVVQSGTNSVNIISNYLSTTLSGYTIYYSFKTDTKAYTRNKYSVSITTKGSVDTLQKTIEALEARIAALEGQSGAQGMI